MKSFADSLAITVNVCDTQHFLSQRDELRDFFADKKTYRMESFYHYMRRKHGVLMDGDKPLTGRWNYDTENRAALSDAVAVPEPLLFDHDLREMYAMVQKSDIPTMGTVDPAHLPWPRTRDESLRILDHFLHHCLPHFGTYQDAMHTGHPFVFHSRLSFSLNTKMLSPREVIDRAVSYWLQHPQSITMAQIEGFIRQILGWREYMRGIYWAKMPDFAHLNFFNHSAPLPPFFWSGDTKMACVHTAVRQSLDCAYAHHIQRLMVTGNFALLAGVHPDEVDAWYLGVYIDAVQWVEITNTRGMSQFADGGIVGTKPYISTARYINKMSNYCAHCHYDYRKRYGNRSCPFNSLYWYFFDRYADRLRNNPRIARMVRMFESMDTTDRIELCRQAGTYLSHLNEL